MVKKDFEIKNKIVSCLREFDEGICASDIAKKIGLNRITVGKYLQILQAEKVVVSKRIASGIFWSLSSNSEKPRILVVDDEPNIVDLIKLSLSNGHYIIYDAFDGEQALKMINEIHPDLVILDLMMPNVSGIEVCSKMKSNIFTQNIPVLIVSAKGEVMDKVELMKIGADDFITKPFDPLELEARVANKLNKKASLQYKNPITNLPSELITEEERFLWSKKKKYFKFILKINNFDEFISLFGHKKSSEVLELFSRMIESVFDSDVFIGHISDSSFLVLSDKSLTSYLDVLKEKFNSTIPFFYPEYMESLTNKKSKILVSIDGKKISHKLISLEVTVDV